MNKNTALFALLLSIFFVAPVHAGVDLLYGEANLSIAAMDSLPITPLMKAAAHGNVNKMKALLGSGARVNQRDSEGATALMLAARYGRPKAVRLLLAHHANPNVQTTDGKNTALLFACSYVGDEEISTWLNLSPFGSGPHLSAKHRHKILAAIEAGRTATVRLLLNHGANPNLLPNVRGMLGNPPALEMAIQTGSNIKIIRLLLEHGANLRNSLEYAVEGNRPDVVKLLLDQGATVRRNIEMLTHAKKLASPQISKLLHLDRYKLLGEKEAVYPDVLNELARKGGVVRKLYRHKWFLLPDYPPTGGFQHSYDYLEVKLIRNTIFARYDYAFDTVWLRHYFSKNFPNYRPLTKTVHLTKTDKRNLEFIEEDLEPRAEGMK